MKITGHTIAHDDGRKCWLVIDDNGSLRWFHGEWMDPCDRVHIESDPEGCFWCPSKGCQSCAHKGSDEPQKEASNGE